MIGNRKSDFRVCTRISQKNGGLKASWPGLWSIFWHDFAAALASFAYKKQQNMPKNLTKGKKRVSSMYFQNPNTHFGYPNHLLIFESVCISVSRHIHLVWTSEKKNLKWIYSLRETKNLKGCQLYISTYYFFFNLRSLLKK